MPHPQTGSAPGTAASLLKLIWLASPALPVGGFSYSEGLEAAVEARCVGHEHEAQAWLLDQLRLGLARSDLAVMARAMPAWQRGDQAEAQRLNDWVTQTRESAEFLQQTQQMGRSLVEWLRNLTAPAGPAHEAPSESASPGATAPRGSIAPHGAAAHQGVADGVFAEQAVAALAALQPAPTWPIAFALAAARSGAPVREALLAFAFGWSENMVQAALKAVPLGQGAGQRILAALSEAIPGVADHALALAEDERQAFTPMLAILSSQHETQYSRLFRS